MRASSGTVSSHMQVYSAVPLAGKAALIHKHVPPQTMAAFLPLPRSKWISEQS